MPEIARALRRRAVSATELAETALDLLGRIGPRYNAIADLPRERALADARRADRRLARGEAPPLAGIPYGAKDLFAARGAPTTWGTPRYRDRVIDEDAAVVSRLERRGAVLAAKLAMVELAGGGRPSRPGASLQGSGRNPWDPTRYSGGSSSGSGIAVALGLVPYALGTETGGSTMSPATFCGVTGLRPTYGTIPRAGAMPLAWTLDKVGLIARSAADVSTVLAAIAERFRPLGAREARSAVRRARIGYADDDVSGCEPHLRKAIGRGLDELRKLAPSWTRAEFRKDLPYSQMLTTVMLAEAATAHAADLEDTSTMTDAKQAAELRAGLDIPARDYLQAMRLRTVLREDARRVFSEVDLIVSASRPHTAIALDGPNIRRTGRTTPDRLGFIGNLAGLPGIALPCGLAEDGLPVALQLVGPPRSEPLLLAVAEAFQRGTGHHLLRPPDA
ncbi:MAG TPA: amidase [Candidatus Limnocylindria bacterium]|nr:amidase [Candidatus Limnocylindria bacterium]